MSIGMVRKVKSISEGFLSYIVGTYLYFHIGHVELSLPEDQEYAMCLGMNLAGMKMLPYFVRIWAVASRSRDGLNTLVI